MIAVYIKKIELIAESEKQNIINSLSFGAKERLNKKRNEKLHLASLCALSLLNDEQRANLEYTENGCPFFTNLDADISVSHSKTHVAVVISNSASTQVGIDVEDISNAIPSTRFLTESERLSFENGVPYEEIWTKKEALFKFLKNDSLPFIKLDSTTPQKHNAYYTMMKMENSILTVCTNKKEKLEIIEK